jgi:hypothetical protein
MNTICISSPLLCKLRFTPSLSPAQVTPTATTELLSQQERQEVLHLAALHNSIRLFLLSALACVQERNMASDFFHSKVIKNSSITSLDKSSQGRSEFLIQQEHLILLSLYVPKID